MSTALVPVSVVTCPRCTSRSQFAVAAGKKIRCARCSHEWIFQPSRKIAVVSPTPSPPPPPTDFFGKPRGTGQPIPRVNTASPVVELLALPFMCSALRRPFVQVYAKHQLGQKFRLVDNVDPKGYLEDAERNGVKISDGRKYVVDPGDIDFSNWQCQHCGHGEVNGDRMSFFRCHCQKLNCARTVIFPQGAVATGVCACGCSAVLNGQIESYVGGSRMIAEQSWSPLWPVA